jgi:carboxylesterase type B
VGCLGQLSPAELQRAAHFVGKNFVMDAKTMIAWSPVIDGVDVVGSPPFLARQGHTHPGPLMLGTARDEGQMFCPHCNADMTEAEFRAWAGGPFGYGDPRQVDTLVGLYRGHANTTGLGPYGAYYVSCTEWYWAATKLTGDAAFHCGSRLGARWVSGRQPVYIYNYSPDSLYAALGALFVMHMDEDSPIYGNNGYGGWTHGHAADAWALLGEEVGRYWYSFAKTGDPNALKHPQAPDWPPYTNATDQNLKLADPISVETGLRKAQCDFCASTFRCDGPGPADGVPEPQPERGVPKPEPAPESVSGPLVLVGLAAIAAVVALAKYKRCLFAKQSAGVKLAVPYDEALGSGGVDESIYKASSNQ